MSQSKVRVRFAPSPTGPLHIGGVRTALYNYLFAKKYGGTFLLRIEDTDQKRFVEGAEEYIIESLKWLNILPTEGVGLGGDLGPYRQSERKDIYPKYTQQLLDAGHAYYAFDTPEELTAKRLEAEAEKQVFKYSSASRMEMKNALSLGDAEAKKLIDSGTPWVIRLKIPADEQVVFQDQVRGEVTYSTNELDDKVLMKTDGLPTYHMANIVDDHLMEISHVIRGEEWLPSTPTHVLLYRYLGWEETMPEFFHLPLILKPTGKGKMSKRDGAKLGIPVFPIDYVVNGILDAPGFREKGFLPQAVINFLVLLGWNPGTDQEVFSLEDLATIFDPKRINKSGARYDFDKAKWFNQQYIMMANDDELAAMARPVFEAQGYHPDDHLLKNICRLLKERVTSIAEFWDQGYYFFEDVTEFDNEKIVRKKWKPVSRGLLEDLMTRIDGLEDYNAEAIENTVKAYMEETGIGFGDVLPFLRLGVSGTMKGPPVFEIMELIGKQTVSHRMKAGFDKFDAIKSQQNQ